MDLKMVEILIDEIIQSQRQTLLKCAQRIVPSVTEEDLLQPNDFSELENHPHFRYEEGVLAGMQTIQMAIKAYQKEKMASS
jgi:hypothetical protein